MSMRNSTLFVGWSTALPLGNCCWILGPSVAFGGLPSGADLLPAPEVVAQDDDMLIDPDGEPRDAEPASPNVAVQAGAAAPVRGRRPARVNAVLRGAAFGTHTAGGPGGICYSGPRPANTERKSQGYHFGFRKK